MINDLDYTLFNFLNGEAVFDSLLDKATLNFCAPDKVWQGKGKDLHLCLYLYDIRENRALRSNELYTSETIGGKVIKKKADPRIDCAYLITAWDKQNPVNDNFTNVNEHGLLADVLQVLLRHATVPTKYLNGLLTGQEPDIPLTVSFNDGLPNPVEFWNAMETPLKPSINCVLTISLDLLRTPVPLTKVTTTQIGYENMETDKPLE